MKRIISCFLPLILSLVFVLSVSAAFANPPILDEAGYLMQSEVKSLSEKLEKLRTEYGFDIAIYTESDMTARTAEKSATKIYDDNGYGAGNGRDGILLYICSDTREYHFVVRGKGKTYFNANGLSYLEKKVVPLLSDDDYYEAFEKYMDTATELVEMGQAGTPFNQKQYSTSYLFGVIAAAIFLPLLIAFILMQMKLRKMKTAVSNNYAENYIKPGSMQVEVSRDLFLYSNITKTERPKPSGNASGGSRGGRGGSF